jgi:enoyl-CoA hydratase
VTTDDTTRRVEVERRGRVGIVTMCRPAKRNAIDRAMSEGIEAAIDDLEDDEDIWAMVLAGEGPVFCAGADLAMVSSGGTAVGPRGLGGITSGRRTKPLVAAVAGPALAGGFELVLACDLVVAGPDAEFGIPEVRRGLIAAAGGVVRLPHRVPRNVAVELTVLGAPIDARRAHHLGLVNRLVDVPRGGAANAAVLEAAVALADEIAANPPVAVRTALALSRRSADEGEAAGWAGNAEAMAVVQASEDFAEGPRAFLDKRAPVWTGR